MVVATYIIARIANQQWQVSAVDETHLERVKNVPINVQQSLNRGFEMQRSLRRGSDRGRWQLITVNLKNNKLDFGFPALLLRQKYSAYDIKNNFIDLKEVQSPVYVRTSNMEFIGPFTITKGEQEHHLYVGSLLRFEQQPAFTFSIALAIFLFIGTISCIAIAYTITKPIKQLSRISKLIAESKKPLLSEHVLNKGELRLEKRKDELGHLHTDMLDMAGKLSKSLAQQRALMANVSHELRTPLTRLQLAIAMLDVNEPKQQEYLKRIEKDIKVMDTLIGQSLQLAKTNDENQIRWLQKDAIYLPKLFDTVIEDLEFEARAKNVELLSNKVPQIELLVVQASLVSAIENVTRNAIKYCAGKVNIRFEIVKWTTVLDVNQVLNELKAEHHTEYKVKQALLIKVEDNGEGLSNDKMENIFEPFYRAKPGQEYQGTGLGLAIAKAAIELHHGKISAAKSDLGGLCIQITMPIFVPLTK